MRIALDARLLCEKEKTGIGWNSKQLIDNIGNKNEYILNYFALWHPLKFRRIFKGYKDNNRCLDVCWFLSASVFERLVNRIKLPYRWVFRENVDITVFFNYVIPPGVSGKKVVFVYDMAYKVFPDTVDCQTKLWLEQKLLKSCSRADAIITISQFSKKEISKYIDVDENKIYIVPCGVDSPKYEFKLEKIAEIKSKYSLPQSYILYLGTIEPRKNIKRLIESYSILRKCSKEVPCMVIAGKRGWMYEEIFELVKELQLEKYIVFTGYIEEYDKMFVMKGASLFVFPSLYEGFGIPPLEAMACGIPVVVSNVSSLPEVVGDAGIMVSPEDPHSIALGMKQILEDNILRNKCIQKGYKQAEKFTWKQSAETFENILNNMI